MTEGFNELIDDGNCVEKSFFGSENINSDGLHISLLFKACLRNDIMLSVIEMRIVSFRTSSGTYSFSPLNGSFLTGLGLDKLIWFRVVRSELLRTSDKVSTDCP